MARRYFKQTVVFAFGLLLVGCGEAAEPPGGVENSPTLSVAITQAPADVKCVDIKAAGTTVVEQRVNVAAGQTTVVTLAGLTFGTAVVTGRAYAVPCASVTASSTPSWISDEVHVVLSSSGPAAVTLRLWQPPRIAVTPDFVTGPGPVIRFDEAPRVLAITPGENEVLGADSLITITFSESMSPLVTEGAYTTDTLPTSPPTFTWNVNRTILTVKETRRLAPASTLTVTLTPVAKDTGGESMAQPMSRALRLARVGTMDLPFQQRIANLAASGNAVAGNAGVFTALVAGSSDGADMAAFAGFDLTTVPAAAKVERAVLKTEVQVTPTGSPFTRGALQLGDVTYAEPFTSGVLQAPFAKIGSLLGPDGVAVGTKAQLDVTSAVAADKAAKRTRTQFRFYFEGPAGTGTQYVTLLRPATSIELTYSLP